MASPVEGNLMLWTAYIEGPEETIWEGGIFTLKLHFSENYPNRPPEVRFLNKMFHPNIYNDGRICLDSIFSLISVLNRQWSPVYDIWAILTAIKSLLAGPNTQSPANIEASNIFKTNKSLFEIKVK
jgi:ubiquitin-conjugating enzyme E2 A